MSARHAAPRERDVLADTYTDLKRISESDTQLSNLADIVKSQVHFAEVATAQISHLKTRCMKLERDHDVLVERVKWMWLLLGGVLGALAWAVKVAIEGRIGHP